MTCRGKLVATLLVAGLMISSPTSASEGGAGRQDGVYSGSGLLRQERIVPAEKRIERTRDEGRLGGLLVRRYADELRLCEGPESRCDLDVEQEICSIAFQSWKKHARREIAARAEAPSTLPPTERRSTSGSLRTRVPSGRKK